MQRDLCVHMQKRYECMNAFVLVKRSVLVVVAGDGGYGQWLFDSPGGHCCIC